MKDSINWLHLSDFHVGKDNYGVRKLFQYILQEIKLKLNTNCVPDFVFITGDIANSGNENEYNTFSSDFITPLKEIISEKNSEILIYSVPGNHDVNRNEARSVQCHNILNRLPHYLYPTDEGLKDRSSIFDRFKNYANFDDTHNELFNIQGSYTKKHFVNDHKIGIVGLNSAWFSENDNDVRNLTPGKYILEESLNNIKDCDIKIVLAHHPIEWFIPNEAKTIKTLLGRDNIIYLCGHLHLNSAEYVLGGRYQYISLQSGSSFMPRNSDNEKWVNRFLWCKIPSPLNEIIVEPKQWNEDNKQWTIDPAYYEDYRFKDIYKFPFPGRMHICNDPLKCAFKHNITINGTRIQQEVEDVHYDIFLSSPIRGYDDEVTYKKERENTKLLIQALKEYCGFENVFWAGNYINDYKSFDDLSEAIGKGIKALDQSKFYVLNLTSATQATGVMFEAGIALNKNKPSIYLVQNSIDLENLGIKPYISDNITTIIYDTIQDLVEKIKSKDKSMFIEYEVFLSYLLPESIISREKRELQLEKISSIVSILKQSFGNKIYCARENNSPEEDLKALKKSKSYIMIDDMDNDFLSHFITLELGIVFDNKKSSACFIHQNIQLSRMIESASKDQNKNLNCFRYTHFSDMIDLIKEKEKNIFKYN